MRNALPRALISLIAVLISLGAWESFLRIYFASHLNYDIEMWRYTTELKQAVSDGRSHIHVPSRRARLMGVPVSINSKGLRDAEYPYEKEAGTYRILAIGDSLGFGWGVPNEQTVPKVLETALNRNISKRLRREHFTKVEVLNMGVGNYNTEQELAALRIEGVRYTPDAVLLLHYINDAEPVQKHEFSWLTTHSYLAAFLLQRLSQLEPYFRPHKRFIQFYQDLYKENWPGYRKILQEFVDETKRKRIKLIPVIMPEMRDLEHYPFKDVHSAVARFFKDSGIPCVDTLPALEGKPSRDYVVARDDPHPNAAADAIIAQAIERKITEENLIP